MRLPRHSFTSAADVLALVEPSGPCWLWTGPRDPLGYGNLRYGGRRIGAHRLVYELLVGPIAPGLVIDHLCRNPSCVNPDHCEPVPQSENVRRGNGPVRTRAYFAAQTHCKHGHEFTPENTRIYRGARICRACARIKALRWYYDHKATA